MSTYGKYSDAEFIALLKETQKKGWTIGHLLESERRGSAFLANEKDLLDDLLTLIKRDF
jgi:hypothetical protein